MIVNSVYNCYTIEVHRGFKFFSVTQDSELPEASEFLTMVQNVQDVLFGICTNSTVLSHYNVTVSTVSLFRVVSLYLVTLLLAITLLQVFLNKWLF